MLEPKFERTEIGTCAACGAFASLMVTLVTFPCGLTFVGVAT